MKVDFLTQLFENKITKVKGTISSRNDSGSEYRMHILTPYGKYLWIDKNGGKGFLRKKNIIATFEEINGYQHLKNIEVDYDAKYLPKEFQPLNKKIELE